ncbi:MAG: aminopeptidase P family protein [Magnetospirillum sp.]|nr:aminopeptidase P family protein [Magnetospirillum sp.]
MSRADAKSPENTAPAERLAALRAELDRRGLAGFIVPRADEHQGEYVAPCAQRLGWLTGFTGSAGVAVVLRDKAALFVDGRYTLQARHEVDAALFEALPVGEHPPVRWVGDNLPQGARFGFDPWLHVGDQVAALRSACQRAGGELVACADNPVDAVWPDRPAPPLEPIFAHPETFAGRSARDKRAELSKQLIAEKVDTVVLTDPAAIAWLLNIRGGDVAYAPLPLCFAILSADGTVSLFVDSRKLSPDVLSHLGSEVTVSPPSALAEALDALGGRGVRVRVDAAMAPFAVVDRLERAGATVDAGQDPCALPKACKNPVELAGARAAHRRDGAALCRFLAWLDREAPGGGVDELTAADVLEEFRRPGEHFRGLSFPTIAGAGPNGAIVHYRSMPQTNRRLESGQLFLIDSGAQYLDGTTDVTRTAAVGEPGPEERRRYTLVLKGHIAVATARFPAGTSGSQLDAFARRFLWAEGLDYDHGTGHGVGSYLSVHEGPQRISKLGNTVALRPGMIVSNEPGYYKAGAYGIRLENLLAVVEAAPPPGAERPLLGFETLTLAPFDPRLIDPALLTAEEADWLDAYHGRVAAELSGLVDDDTRAWLASAARPLRRG